MKGPIREFSQLSTGSLRSWLRAKKPRRLEKRDFWQRLAELGRDREEAEVSSIQFVFFSFFCRAQLRRRTVRSIELTRTSFLCWWGFRPFVRPVAAAAAKRQFRKNSSLISEAVRLARGGVGKSPSSFQPSAASSSDLNRQATGGRRQSDGEVFDFDVICDFDVISISKWEVWSLENIGVGTRESSRKSEYLTHACVVKSSLAHCHSAVYQAVYISATSMYSWV